MGAEPRQRPKGFTVWEAMHGASELERSEGWREQRCCLRLLEIEDAERFGVDTVLQACFCRARREHDALRRWVQA